MKIIIFIGLSFLMHSLAIAQPVRVGLYLGYGSYMLHDLKEFQNEMVDNYQDIGVKKTQEFPGYLNYDAIFEYYLNPRTAIAWHFGYYSTGGRNHVADYSGEYVMNMHLNGLANGIQYKYLAVTKNKLDFYCQVKLDLISSKLDIDEKLELYGAGSSSDNLVLVSNSLALEPSLGLNFRFPGRLSMDLNLGYMQYADSRIHKEGERDAALTLNNSAKVMLDWSGLRVRTGFFYQF